MSRATHRLRHLPWSSAVLWTVLVVLIVAPVTTFLLCAVSPRLFSLGPQWFTLSSFSAAFQGHTLEGIINSLWVSTTVATLAVVIGTTLAWLVHRTNLFGAKVIGASLWLLLLIPTWMTTVGWINVVQPGELLSAFGLNTVGLSDWFFGAPGVIIILTTAALPFSYLIISAGLRGLGSEFEDAARVHGAGMRRALTTVLPIIAPALLGAFAISFAEAISDFGVAFTISQGHQAFPLATFTLFGAIYQQPSNFSVAAVIAMVLIVATIPPIFFQQRLMRGRSYAVLSARTRPVRRLQLRPLPRAIVSISTATFVALLVGIPLSGAVASSFTSTVSFYTTTGIHWTLDSYRGVFNPPPAYGGSLSGPLWTSSQLGFYVALATLVLAVAMARRMTVPNPGRSQRVADVFLLGAVAIPGIVLAAGYILFFNQAFLTHHLVDLYETTPLVVMGLVAASIPGQTRLLMAPVAQVHAGLGHAARVHGAGRWRTWRTTTLPLLSRTLVWAWAITFTKTLAELAIVELLYVPGHEPASVQIENYLGSVHGAVGAAATVLLLLEMLAVIGLSLGLFRVLAPRGWRRIGQVGAMA